MPRLNVVAGPNGSGKSTLTSSIWYEGNAKARGYRTFLVYVSLGDPDLHIERVRLRVSLGGHDIPDSDVRRRYWGSLSRAPEALHLADEAVVLDNSGIHPIRMLWFKRGQLVWRAATVPDWVERLAG